MLPTQKGGVALGGAGVGGWKFPLMMDQQEPPPQLFTSAVVPDDRFLTPSSALILS
jgi:hypothetical protein